MNTKIDNRRTRTVRGVGPFAFLVALASVATAEDWPVYQHDNQRSGVSTEQVQPPLAPIWVHRSKNPPAPSWPLPAQRDYWHQLESLSSRAGYDRAFHPVATRERLFFGSSTDDRIYCLDTASGDVRWSYFTEGPVRVAPSISGGRVYAGSDDGYVYCLNASDGTLVWKYSPAPGGRRVLGNGRMISPYPIRTSVLVEDGTAYFCAGLFPNEGVYVCAVDAKDSTEIWKHRAADIAPQGYLLASPGRLYIPNGRNAPWIYDRRSGEPIGQLGGSGGTYALLVDDILIHGPGSTGQLSADRTDTKHEIASFNGLHIIIHENSAYLLGADELTALDRRCHFQTSQDIRRLQARQAEIAKGIRQLGNETAGPKGDELRQEVVEVKTAIAEATRALQDCVRWKQPSSHPHNLILAGKVLWAGGENTITAIETAKGEVIWSAPVEGRAYGLAVAGRTLYVSTDQGTIHAFRREE